MRPMDMLSTLAGKVIAGGIAVAAVAAGLSAFSPDKVDTKNAVKAHDSYVVSLDVTREGSELDRNEGVSSGSVYEDRKKWRHGPTIISTRLVPLSEDVHNGYGNGSAIVGLEEWSDKIEYWSDQTRNISYEPYAKEIHKVLKKAEALQDDVDLLLRVLRDIQVYHYQDDKSWYEDDPDHPISELPYVYFQGAKTEHYNSSVREGLPNPEKNEAPSWSSLETKDDGIARNLGENLELVVWRYTQEDMKRVQAIIKKLDDIESDLTFDVSAFNPKKSDPQIVEMTARDLRYTFHNNFVVSVNEIVRLAWGLSPKEAPESYWATSVGELNSAYESVPVGKIIQDLTTRRDLSDLPYLKKDVPLSLPPLPTDTLIALTMPLRGFVDADHPTYRHMDVKGQYNLRDEGIGKEVYSVNFPSTMRYEFFRSDRDGSKDSIHSRSVIHAAVDGEHFNGLLTVASNHNDKHLSKDGNTSYLEQYKQTYKIGWTVKHDGAVCRNPDCFPKEEEENPEYQAPPVIAIAAATYPEIPLPKESAALGFRVQNNSDIIASAVGIELRLMSALTELAPDDLVPHGEFCKTTDTPGRFRCDFGDMAPGATADIMFDAKTPRNGLFIWSADLDSKGDLGGLTKRGGFLGKRTKPKILDVIVIDRQIAFEDEVPVHPYPFGPHGDGDLTRNVFVIGTDLPEEKEDVSLTHSAKIKYFFEAFDDTDNPDHKAIIDKGWMKYFKVDDAAKANALAKEKGLRGILVDTRISKGVMPGNQTLKLNGTDGIWPLQFGDISAQLHFVRFVEDEPFDLLNNAYAPGRVYLAVQTNMELPIDSIPLNLDLSQSGVKGAKNQKIVAKRADYLGKRIYLSPPLDLYEMNDKPSLEQGISIPVQTAKKKPVQLTATIDDDFVSESFLLAEPPLKSTVKIWSSPSMQGASWRWNDALRRTAACHKDELSEYNMENIGATESKSIWNMIILTQENHILRQSAKFGHHAAALLLRDMYLEVASEQDSRDASKYNDILRSEEAIQGFMNMLRTRIYDRTIPILRMKTKHINGDEIEYRYVILNDPEWLAEQYNLTVDEVKARRRAATIEAVDKIRAEARAAKALLEEIGDCDVKKLLSITGFSFEPISRVLKSELVTTAGTRLSDGSQHTMWVSDSTARYWVDQVAPFALAVRQQEKLADKDTDLSLALLSIVTMPLMLGENVAVSLITLGLDLVDFGATTAHELDQYFDSQRELTFSKGAAVILGEDRYKKAQENAKAWYSTALSIGMSGFGVATGALETVPKLTVMNRIARGRKTARNLESVSAIDVLSNAERQDFAAFAMSSHMRRTELGASSLTDAERRSIELVDQYASSRMATRTESKMDLPPSKLVESFQPKQPIAFELINSSGVRKLDVPKKQPAPASAHSPEPPPGFDPDASSVPMSNSVEMKRAAQNIDEPVFGDEIPNSFDKRVPDDTVVKVMDSAKGEMELELGARVGNPGSTSEAFALLDDPENFVVRITYLREGSSAVKLDAFGDNVLRNKIKSEHIRAVEIRDDYQAAAGRVRTEDSGSQSPAVRVTVAERVTPAYEMLREQTGGVAGGRGTMTVAQMQAYEGAMRDLNASGYVWLDNKPDNFAFKALDDGSGRVQVVVIDTGGIVPVRQSVADFLGISKGDLARQIQLRANGKFETYLPEFAYIKDMNNRSICRYETIKELYGDAIDLDALGIKDIDNLWFNQVAGELYDYVAPLLEAMD